jgi:4,5-dihydroxyphthalate decarboxylase
MLFNADRGKLAPSDLPGKRIGVRSYSQTTGVWIRGILENDFGVDLGGAQWVTFEDGHVAEARDPAGVIRARGGQDITEMLIAGDLDAAIYGAALPKDPRLQSVIPDPEAAARTWYARHGLVPVNHMVVVTDELARSRPDAVAEFYRLLEEARRVAPPGGPIDTAPFGRQANRQCLDLLMSYCEQQKLISRRPNFDELW